MNHHGPTLSSIAVRHGVTRAQVLEACLTTGVPLECGRVATREAGAGWLHKIRWFLGRHA